MGSLAEADTRETPEQVANAKAKIEPLSVRLLRVMKGVKVPLETAIENVEALLTRIEALRIDRPQFGGGAA